MKRKLFIIAATIFFGQILAQIFGPALYLIAPAIPPQFILLFLIPGYILAWLSWTYLPGVWDFLVGRMQDPDDNYDRFSRSKALGWQQMLFLVCCVAYLFYVIRAGYLTFVNWYINLDSNGWVTYGYYALSVLGVLVVGAVSLVLTLLFWVLIHRSAAFRALGAAVSILLLAGVAWTFLDLGGLTTTGSELAESMVSGEMIGRISPFDFPDTNVLMWAAPSVVLAYYGADSPLGGAAKWAKRISVTAVILSATAACTAIRLALWGLFHH